MPTPFMPTPWLSTLLIVTVFLPLAGSLLLFAMPWALAGDRARDRLDHSAWERSHLRSGSFMRLTRA